MDQISLMLNAAKESNSGRFLVVDNNGAERVYDRREWNDLDADSLKRMTEKKHVMVEKTLNAAAVNALDKYYDLQESGANKSEIERFWLHEDDEAFYVYWFECVYNGRDAGSLLKYSDGDYYWSCIW